MEQYIKCIITNNFTRRSKPKCFKIPSTGDFTEHIYGELLLRKNDKYENVKSHTLEMIKAKYSLSLIEIAPACYGCRYDRPGQRDHMECSTGCLHNPDICENC